MLSQYINHIPFPYSIHQNTNNKQQFKIKRSPPSNFRFTLKKSKTMMISARKLIKMARKWQMVAALGRKRLSSPIKIEDVSTSDHASEPANKGHFIVYTTDKVRFVFPISYLNSLIFRELLRMSEEEFGLPSDGPITFPCDSQFMGYVTSLMRKKAAEDVEKALLLTMAACRCPSSHNLDHQQTIQHPLLSCC